MPVARKYQQPALSRVHFKITYYDYMGSPRGTWKCHNYTSNPCIYPTLETFGNDATGEAILRTRYSSVIEPAVNRFRFSPVPKLHAYVEHKPPFCEKKVRFNHYFWEGGHEPRIECEKFMHSGGCSLIDVRILNSTHGWLEYNQTLICLGLRGDPHLISVGLDPEWVPLYRSTNYSVMTVAGDFMYAQYRGEYMWVSSSIMEEGLTITSQHLVGLRINDHLTHFIPFSKFVLARSDSLRGLLDKVIFVLYEKDETDRIDLVTEKQMLPGSIIGTTVHGVITEGNYIVNTRHIGSDPYVVFQSYSEVSTLLNVNYQEYDDQRSWYNTLLDDFYRYFSDKFSLLLDYFTFSIGKLILNLNPGYLLTLFLPHLVLYKHFGFIPAITAGVLLLTLAMMWGKIDPG